MEILELKSKYNNWSEKQSTADLNFLAECEDRFIKLIHLREQRGKGIKKNKQPHRTVGNH